MIELDVIVVGAGLAGLAAANGLRRAGHRVKVHITSKPHNYMITEVS
jgi:2-polyprenyl-6-methoxyphenol hydroxylase-like FAD-dependent oxidoreductase